ncbi:MAG: hypothetical protein K6F35_08350 [Lachnospiraceae bacterium]|nr:hypothetical protein [Lachnospiraceae bacterium]
MNDNQINKENQKAIMARDASFRETFLAENSGRILRLASKILDRRVTKSDDEWSVALIATSEALDKYDPEKGDFWGFASIVIRSRLLSLIQNEKRSSSEISVSPGVFEGEIEEEDPELSIKIKVQSRMAEGSFSGDNPVADEIDALEDELQKYGISFFDLTACSPKAGKTRKRCAEVITAFFLPPPLMELLMKTRKLPIKELTRRCSQSEKLLDKYRKYLIASVLILDGDYPELSEYLESMKPQNRSGNLLHFKERRSV